MSHRIHIQTLIVSKLEEAQDKEEQIEKIERKLIKKHKRQRGDVSRTKENPIHANRHTTEEK